MKIIFLSLLIFFVAGPVWAQELSLPYETGSDCFDGADNDRDGLIDCSDRECDFWCSLPSPPTPLFSSPLHFFGGLEHCFDGVDNTGDGLVDCQDPACAGGFACVSPSPAISAAPLGASSLISQSSTGQSALVSTSGVLAAIATASAFVSVASVAAGAQSGPEFLRSLLPFSAIHRRQAPWGRVVETGSNTPIAGAVLSLLDEGGKVRATEKSRSDGTFGFFVPPGTYRLIAQQDGYQFLAPVPDIALFPGENVYDGGWIHIQEESIVALVVAGQEISQTAFTTMKEFLQGIWTRVQVWQARLALPLLLVGGGLTLLSFWNSPSLLLGALLVVYVILFSLELLLTRVARRTVGVVQDATTRGGVGLAVVRLLDEAGRLSATRVTLKNGHFFLMPAPGKYRVEIVHPRYQPYHKDPLRVRKFFFGVAGIRAKLFSK